MNPIPLPSPADVAVLIALLDDDTLGRYHERLIAAHGQAGRRAFQAGRLAHERQTCPECGSSVEFVDARYCDDAGAEEVWDREPWSCTGCDATGDRDGVAA